MTMTSGNGATSGGVAQHDLGRSDALLWLLLDSRAPSGGHAHSAGMEAAVMADVVRDIVDVEAFCRGRLRTSARVSAAFAAAACRLIGKSEAGADCSGPDRADPEWGELDAELDARLPSEALRSASRTLGSGLRRLVRSMFPAAVLPWPLTPAPHHPLVLGAAVALAGGGPHTAADAAMLATITSPASAAVRLLGLDPLAVHGLLARLVTEFGSDTAAWAASERPSELAADCAPYLDLLADIHRTSEVRLFAS